ncbi:MAG: DUF268 domain-containing protein [Myxococcales bacterium]|nr:DUF268 domain-containing protein [Myxococcales bacterium]
MWIHKTDFRPIAKMASAGRRTLSAVGFYPERAFGALRGGPFFVRSLKDFKQMIAHDDFGFPLTGLYPCLNDRNQQSGQANGHYFHQDLLVARKIYEANPTHHVDVGSRLDGFIAHVASFREIEVFDIREEPPTVPHVSFRRMDFMSESLRLSEYCDSISSLHAIEHFGLGRYGDPIRPDGHLVGLTNIHRALTPGGKFYLSVPIGPQRVEFNAHRVFALRYLSDLLSENYEIDSFAYVDDRGTLHENADLCSPAALQNFSCYFGCGIFELTKRPSSMNAADPVR